MSSVRSLWFFAGSDRCSANLLCVGGAFLTPPMSINRIRMGDICIRMQLMNLLSMLHETETEMARLRYDILLKKQAREGHLNGV